MDSGPIFIVSQNGELTRMRLSAPESEDRMQLLIANHPELIGDADGSLLLIRREQPIDDAAEASGRWSLDHLFVTRSAIPVLVEVKRAVDTRLRREVVGQMLDYAANGVAYWKGGTIASAFEATCQMRDEDTEATLRQFLGDGDPAVFWEQVDANFQAGRIKLVFVADVIPRELARVVEFLNEQMRADVRAVELRWYQGQGDVTTLVPRIIGETARAVAQKAAVRGSQTVIGVDEWIEKHIRPKGDDALQGTEAFIEVIEQLGGQVGAQKGSIYGMFRTAADKPIYPLHLWDNGTVSPSFGYLAKRPGLANEGVRKAIYDEFVAAVGSLSTSNLAGFPGFKVSVLTVPRVRTAFSGAAKRLVETASVD